ncbi:patatin-like phospholipase family protein [Streptacidiphilus sp. NEAU-YB345]|uniref:Patatin-like phospholipase family protein n=1 Tax=Streptacidiphilus fuscans TaxID=2789292 RepID=A0A931FEL0_9ACTN|nr:patatin-like phospholipase family protein [Streptacidiphilus fuscans]
MRAKRDKALVLGGGGLTGIGWECGILHGLAEAGIDLAGTTDVIIGTSAGSVVGAQLTSGLLDVRELYERQIAAVEAEEARGSFGRSAMLRFVWEVARSRDARSFGVRMGALAMAGAAASAGSGTVPSPQRASIERRLLSHEWPGPERRLVVTAVDAETGEFAALDRDGELGLVDAVAASCSVPGVWPPTRAAGRTWIDGGIRSSANADLAQGYRSVVVIAPLPVGAGPIASPRSQVERLTASGSRVALITPDRAARRAFGRNMLDPSRRASAARAGFAQASAHVEAVAAAWCSGGR